LSASLDNTIWLWDTKSEMTTISIMENDEKSELSSMSYLLEAGLVATGHEDGHIRLWNLEIGTHVLITGEGGNKMKHWSTVSCIKGIKYKGSEYLICGSYDGRISVWEISLKAQAGSTATNWQVYPQLKSVIQNYVQDKSELFGNEIHAIHYFPSERDNEEKIIVGGNPIDINIFLLKTSEKEATLNSMHTDSVTCLCMDGYFLFSGSDDMTIVIWNMTNYT